MSGRGVGGSGFPAVHPIQWAIYREDAIMPVERSHAG